MSDAREVVLGRIRAALADRPQPSAAVLPPTPPAPADPVALFAERAGEYRARRAPRRLRPPSPRWSPRSAPRTVPAVWPCRRICRRAGCRPAWSATGDATVSALDRVDGVLTGCAAAIAETGTIVLDGGPGQGIRALTLVPDLHICIVPAELVCASVQRGVPAGGAVGTAAPRPADADLGAVRHLRHRAVAGRGRARPPPAGDRDRRECRRDRPVRPVADRVEVAVAGRPLAHRVGIGREGLRQQLDRLVAVAGQRAVAGRVVEDRRVARVLGKAGHEHLVGRIRISALRDRVGREVVLPRRRREGLARLSADREHGRVRLRRDGVALQRRIGQVTPGSRRGRRWSRRPP